MIDTNKFATPWRTGESAETVSNLGCYRMRIVNCFHVPVAYATGTTAAEAVQRAVRVVEAVNWSASQRLGDSAPAELVS